MIEIIKILEGGIDLRTGVEEPRSLVLVHEGAQALMPVSDEQLSIILSLLGSKEHEDVQLPDPPAAPTPVLPKVADNGSSATWVKPSAGETYDDPETGVSSF